MKLVVGIFSREDHRGYKFLSDFLKAQDCVREVSHFTITNNGFQRLQDEASRCHCAILYHSKNRGRLNITNVVDSLYDEELQDLSNKLGKKKVLVVADDLDSSSSEAKLKILQSQPLIAEMAAGLFLFSKLDKNSEDLLNEKLQEVSQIFRRGSKISDRVRSVQEVVRPNNLLRQWVMMVVGYIQLIYSQSIRCVRMVVGYIQLIYSLPTHCVEMVVGYIQPIYSQSIRCVRMVVGYIQPIYSQSIRCVRMVVGYIQLTYTMPTHYVEIVVGYIQPIYSQSIRCVRMVVGYIQLIYSLPTDCVGVARRLFQTRYNALVLGYTVKSRCVSR